MQNILESLIESIDNLKQNQDVTIGAIDSVHKYIEDHQEEEERMQH